jgi:hypothetical protein
VYQQTFPDENDQIGIVDPTLVPGIAPSCLDPVMHQPIPGSPCAVLAPYDLTGGGGSYARDGLFSFRGHTDVKELALYLQDAITKGNWAFNVGLRGDFYNALSTDHQAEPRLGNRHCRQASLLLDWRAGAFPATWRNQPRPSSYTPQPSLAGTSAFDKISTLEFLSLLQPA